MRSLFFWIWRFCSDFQKIIICRQNPLILLCHKLKSSSTFTHQDSMVNKKWKWTIIFGTPELILCHKQSIWLTGQWFFLLGSTVKSRIESRTLLTFRQSFQDYNRVRPAFIWDFTVIECRFTSHVGFHWQKICDQIDLILHIKIMHNILKELERFLEFLKIEKTSSEIL